MAQHPFSRLNEMFQMGTLTFLRYEDLDAVDGQWIARISASSTFKTLPTFSKVAAGPSKQVAKRKAAALVLEVISNQTEIPRHLASPTSSLSDDGCFDRSSHFSSPSLESEQSDASSPPMSPALSEEPELTARQQRILDDANRHIQTLQHMAKERGVMTPPTTFISVDVEAWEKGDEVLEVGVAWADSTEVWERNAIHSTHYIIKENMRLRNGRHVPDNRDHFEFGESTYATLDECKGSTKALLMEITKSSKICIIGHSVDHDIKWVEGLGVNLNEYSACDVALVDCARRSDHSRRKLGVMLDEHGIDHAYLHNGGNDAVFTLKYWIGLMEQEEKKRMEGLDVMPLI